MAAAAFSSILQEQAHDGAMARDSVLRSPLLLPQEHALSTSLIHLWTDQLSGKLTFLEPTGEVYATAQAAGISAPPHDESPRATPERTAQRPLQALLSERKIPVGSCLASLQRINGLDFHDMLVPVASLDIATQLEAGSHLFPQPQPAGLEAFRCNVRDLETLQPLVAYSQGTIAGIVCDGRSCSMASGILWPAQRIDTMAQAFSKAGVVAMYEQPPTEHLYCTRWQVDIPADTNGPSAVSIGRQSFVASPDSSTLALDALSIIQTLCNVGKSGLLKTQLPESIVQGCAAPALDVAGAAAMYGVVKSALLEFPNLHMRIQSCDVAQSPSSPWCLGVPLAGSPTDGFGVSIAGGAALVPKLSRIGRHSTAIATLPCARGSFLITGGSGALGGLMASYLAHAGASSVVCLSRSGVVDIAVVEDCSCACHVASTKIDAGMDADMEGVGTELKSVVAGSGVTMLHAGGVLADALLLNQNRANMQSVMGPKYDAALLTRALSTVHASRQEVYFSSVASLMGSPGQSNYCAANAMLDALAASGSQQGLPSVAIQWGAWAGVGMGVADRSTEQRQKRIGVGMISARSGLSMLAAILSDAARTCVVAAVPFRWSEIATKKPIPPFLSLMVDVHAPEEAVAEGSGDASLTAASIEPTVETIVAGILGAPVERDQPLMSAGLDSLGTMELRNALESALNVSLPSTVVFDYPTIGGLAAFLATQTSGGAVATQVDVLASVGQTLPVENRNIFAVCGLAQRSPLDALSFWRHGPIDAVGQVPLERWDVETAPLVARFGAYLPCISAFDAALFRISSVEATLMDPQQRLLLETVAESTLALVAESDTAAPVTARGFFVGE